MLCSFGEKLVGVACETQSQEVVNTLVTFTHLYREKGKGPHTPRYLKMLINFATFFLDLITSNIRYP